MNEWFEKIHIKEIPIEEQIRGQVRAECHYMDKADIYEWITQNQIKIMNLQSKIDKAIEYIKIQQKIFKDYDIVSENQLNNLLDILKGDK